MRLRGKKKKLKNERESNTEKSKNLFQVASLEEEQQQPPDECHLRGIIPYPAGNFFSKLFT